MALRIGIDIGGTFTDLVALDEATGALVDTKALSTPHDLLEGILRCVDQAGRAWPTAASSSTGPPSGSTPARAQGRADRPDHHRGVPGRARDRPRQLPPHVRRALPPARRAGAARPPPRGERARDLARRRADPAGRGGGARRGPAARRRGGRVGRDLVPVLLPKPGARAARRRAGRGGAPAGVGLGLAPDHPGVARVRAHQHHGGTPTSGRYGQLPRRLRAGPRRSRLPRPAPDLPVERRGCSVAAAASKPCTRSSRARGGGDRLREPRAGARRGPAHLLRHGRDHRQSARTSRAGWCRPRRVSRGRHRSASRSSTSPR